MSLCASSTALGQAPLPLYLNTLENTFQNWSWIPNNFADTTYVASRFCQLHQRRGQRLVIGEAISLGSDVVNAYQGMELSPYQNLVFWMNGGASGGQKLQVFPGNFNGSGVGGTYSLPALTAGTWTQFTIPVSTICPPGTTNIDRFTFQLTPNGTTNTWSLGDIYFTAKPAPALVNLSVDASQTIRTADPALVRRQYRHLRYRTRPTPFTSNALAQAGLMSLRFPGGSESDDYHWSTSRKNDNNTWAWGTSFANLAHLATNAGTQVFTTVNYGSGTSNEAAAWGRLCQRQSCTNTLPLGTDQFGTNWHTAGYWASLRAAAPLGSDDGYNFLLHLPRRPARLHKLGDRE